MAEIDNLEVKIEQDVGGALNGLDKVISTLEKLQGAMSKVSGVKLFGDNMTTETQRTVDLVKQSVKDIPQMLTQIPKGIKDNFSKIFDGFNKAELPKKSLFYGYSNEFVDLSRDIDATTQKINELSDAINRMSAKGQKTPIAEQELRREQKELDALKQKMFELEQAGGDRRGFVLFKNIANGMKGVPEGIANVTNGVKNFIGDIGGAINSSNNFNNAMKKLIGGGLKLFGRGVIAPIKAVGNVFGQMISPVKNLGKALERTGKMLRLMFLRTALRAFVTNTQDGFKNLIMYSSRVDASVSMLRNSMKALGNAFAAATSPIINAFAPALTFLIDQIITAINYINQLLSALFGNNTWTKAIKQSDSYANSLNKAGGAAKGLNKQLQKFDELNNITTNESGGGGGGGGTDASGLYSEEEIESKWKNLADRLRASWADADYTWFGTLLGEKLLDSLNTLDDQILPKFKNTAKKIGKAIGTTITGFVQVEGLGEKIGKTLADAIGVAVAGLNSFVTNVNWKSVGEFIGDAINGFALSGLIGDVLTLLVNSLNGAISLLSNIGKRIKWKELGEELGKSFTEAISKLDAKELAQGITTWIKGALEGITTFLKKTDFEIVGKKIGEFISNIDFAGIVIDLGKLGAAIIDAIVSAIKGLWTDGDAIGKIALAIGGLLGAAKIAGGTFTLSAFKVDATEEVVKKATTGLASKIFTGVTASLAVAFAGFSFGQWLAEHTDIDENFEVGLNIVFGEPKVITDYESYVKVGGAKWGAAYGKLYADSVMEGIESGLSQHEAIQRAIKIVDDAVGKNTEKIRKDFGEVRTGWRKTEKSVAADSEKIKKSINEAMKSADGDLFAFVKSIANVSKNVNENTEKMHKGFGTLKDKINSSMTLAQQSVTSKMASIFNSITNNSSNASKNAISSFDTMKTKINSAVESARKKATSEFTTIKNNLTSSSSTAKQNVTTNFSNMKTSSDNSFSSMKNFISTTMANIKSDTTTKATQLKEGTVSALNGVSEGVNSKFAPMPGLVKARMDETTVQVTGRSWHGAGSGLVNTLKSGIEGAWSGGGSSLLSRIIELAKNLANSLRNAFGLGNSGVGSSLNVGSALANNIADGFDKSSNAVINSVKDLKSKVNAELNSGNLNNPLSDINDLSTNASINTTVNANGQNIAENVAKGVSEGLQSSQAQQNALLREQNELLRNILEKDTGISASEIFESVKRSNRADYNRTGRNALVY